MNAPVKIHLNGTLITGRVDGLDSFQITFRNNIEEGYYQKSYSTELSFYDDGFNILKQELIDSVNAFGNEVKVEIFDECCSKLIFEGLIKADSIDWCEPICAINASVIEKKSDLDCLKSTLITDNHAGFQQTPQKKLRYCIDFRPDALLFILFLIYSILNLVIYAVLIPLSLIVVIIQSVAFVICQIICAIPATPCNSQTCSGGTWTNPQGSFDDITGWLDDFQSRMIFCNWYHPTALLRDYIKNACSACGLQFESSILNDPASTYYDTLLFSAPIRKGYKPSQTQDLLISENFPLETIETLMRDHLMTLFNARYWVKDGKLIFERKDFFDESSVWIDAEAMLVNNEIIENEICFKYIDKERPSFAIYAYASDATDYMANEAKGKFDNIIEWNNPYSSTQVGKHELNFTSSQARFRNDQVTRDAYEELAQIGLINALFGNAFSEAIRNLFMNQHTATNYKFLIWDASSGDSFAYVKSDYSNSFTGGDYYLLSANSNGTINPDNIPENLRYNYPFTFYEGYYGNAQNNLYFDFHIIDNPRIGSSKKFEFSFSFNFDCDQIAAFDFTKTVRLRQGNAIRFGEVKELKIDYLNRTVTVQGIV